MIWNVIADYYTWPFVTVFGLFDDLGEKLKAADLPGISRKMKAHNFFQRNGYVEQMVPTYKGDRHIAKNAS